MGLQMSFAVGQIPSGHQRLRSQGLTVKALRWLLSVCSGQHCPFNSPGSSVLFCLSQLVTLISSFLGTKLGPYAVTLIKEQVFAS